MTTFLKDYVGEWNIGLKFKWMKRTTTFIQILHVADRSYLILSYPRRTVHTGEEPYCTGTLLHIFDSKKASEAASQPKVRNPPLRDF